MSKGFAVRTVVPTQLPECRHEGLLLRKQRADLQGEAYGAEGGMSSVSAVRAAVTGGFVQRSVCVITYVPQSVLLVEPTPRPTGDRGSGRGRTRGSCHLHSSLRGAHSTRPRVVLKSSRNDVACV